MEDTAIGLGNHMEYPAGRPQKGEVWPATSALRHDCRVRAWSLCSAVALRDGQDAHGPTPSVSMALPQWALQGPFRANDYEIRMSADFSKETNECCKAFLSLRPHLRQLEVT
ncbi:hypothetical protein NDU88_007029 [Pleurodeles waltl]|uniref:Uncharacterized protein n=1 Tax=Pleurodeles waltl TaxID=8319 RepID=A0AAV7RQH1_PLEWA|nr:hypothetical protein NDU88_007029 [Pleurodeles waltl]